jgi:hypothetical protein
MKYVPDYRIFDSRKSVNPPATLFAIPTNLVGKKVAQATVTVIPQGKRGYLTIGSESSVLNFGADQATSENRPFLLADDGNILLGSSTPVHLVVDITGYGE